jgi:hypothetical protein
MRDVSGQPRCCWISERMVCPCLVIAPLPGEQGRALERAKMEVDVGENMKLAGHYRLRDFIRQHGGI